MHLWVVADDLELFFCEPSVHPLDGEDAVWVGLDDIWGRGARGEAIGDV